ncbi:MAG TPA: (d)CMP kinase [Ktedonobacter sp.]|nr:(d)CMP kinase [Ktedonobacter sp.]HCF86686.1 (d)CMP kinase [Ktedonobacter sp.]
MQQARRIAIDGPAGSGKSTIGEELARRLGYLYIDTGAMYRALTWLALKEGVDITDGAAMEELARHAEIVISRPRIDDGRQYTVTVHGQDVTWDIRSAAVTNAVSVASSHKGVRAIIIGQQRAMAQRNGVVMVGRDIGSVVLPDAELKIFLTASLEERARRRYAELLERYGTGNPALLSMETVLEDIRRRDYIDRDNLRQTEDAIVVTTDHLGIPQVLEVILHHLESST